MDLGGREEEKEGTETEGSDTVDDEGGRREGAAAESEDDGRAPPPDDGGGGNVVVGGGIGSNPVAAVVGSVKPSQEGVAANSLGDDAPVGAAAATAAADSRASSFWCRLAFSFSTLSFSTAPLLSAPSASATTSSIFLLTVSVASSLFALAICSITFPFAASKKLNPTASSPARA